jgi:uncharacterized SAM-binding protein YcdF (DUF218 family)
MTDNAFLKPWLTALALPPASLLLLIFLGYLMATRSRSIAWLAIGKMFFMTALIALWLASCHGTAMYLQRVALRPPAALEPDRLAATLQQEQIQAVVVLGGGQQSASREYGAPGLSDDAAQRLHYGAMLARVGKLPLMHSGGVGWAAGDREGSEAAAAHRWLQQLGLPGLRWQESQSRDTAGNAQATAALLKKQGIQRIALVTSATHMPRALLEFRKTDLTILPAATQFLETESAMGLDWFPSATGLRRTRQILHELLGMAVMDREKI